MEKITVEEKIKQKEKEIVGKIEQLKYNEEVWSLLMKGSCFWSICGVSRDSELAKVDLYNIISYVAHIEEIFLENLQENTLTELWDILALYLEKRQIYRSEKK